jgi:hypothetical protein
MHDRADERNFCERHGERPRSRTNCLCGAGMIVDAMSVQTTNTGASVMTDAFPARTPKNQYSSGMVMVRSNVMPHATTSGFIANARERSRSMKAAIMNDDARRKREAGARRKDRTP